MDALIDGRVGPSPPSTPIAAGLQPGQLSARHRAWRVDSGRAGGQAGRQAGRQAGGRRRAADASSRNRAGGFDGWLRIILSE